MSKLKNLKIYNGFGVTPSKKGKAAGWDFHIPNIKKNVDDKELQQAIKDTYKLDDAKFAYIWDLLAVNVCAVYGPDHFEGNEWNILLLYLSLTSWKIENCDTIDDKISLFLDEYLVFDEKLTPGVVYEFGNKIFFNTGIRILLDENTVGIYHNKSGIGSRGWDLGACVVDEDYRGWLCVSAFYRGVYGDVLYCGDKLTQMVITPVLNHPGIDELTYDEYVSQGAGSERGTDGFGSGDIKH